MAVRVVVVILKWVPYELAATVNEVPDATLEYNGRYPLRMVTPPFTSRAVAGVVVWMPKLEPVNNRFEFPNNPVPPVFTVSTPPNPVYPVIDTELPPPPDPGIPWGPVHPVTP